MWMWLLLFVPVTAFAQTTIRIVASNTTSGNNQSYEPAASQRILQALDGDITLMQEFNVAPPNDAAAVTSFVNTNFGPGFYWYREAGAQIPNGIVSRWPIIASGEWDDTNVSNRDFAWARIDIPGAADLYAISVHFLTSNATDRNSEAQQVVNQLIPSLNIPAGAYLVVGGDLNTGSRTESCISTLSSRVVTAGPYPVGDDGNSNTNAGRNEPYDWVLANSTLDALESSTTYGAFSYANGLVFDTRNFTQAELNSAFSPALTTDSAAVNMQHMAVIRTFTIPAQSAVGDWPLY